MENPLKDANPKDTNAIIRILPEKHVLSQWSLNYKAFGRDIEFSWLARNMQQKMPYSRMTKMIKIANIIFFIKYG
ncbi:hypothetical protein VNO77_20688 [Canavalia gladiata]|uniref:Uncharacterized protein n=1 Tax=Canavalia gladiata TaxID=3824 RepID=A0AAN9LU00_CANGL